MDKPKKDQPSKISRIHDKRTNDALRAEFDDLFKLYSLYWLQNTYKINPALEAQLTLIKRDFPIAKMAWEIATTRIFSNQKLYFDWLRQQPEILTKIENGKSVAYLKVKAA